MPDGLLDEPAFAPDSEMMLTRMKVRDVSQPEDRHVARAPQARDLPFLIDGDMLQVHNDGEVDFLFRWARKSYVCKAHQDQFVPFEAVANQLGDPRSVEGEITKFDDGNGNRGIVMTRYDELCRLFAMYGVQQENIGDLVEKSPKLSIRTMTGQKIPFPIHVPDMLCFPVNKVDNQHVNSDVTRMYENLQNENEELRARTERMEAQMDELMRQREGVEDKV